MARSSAIAGVVCAVVVALAAVQATSAFTLKQGPDGRVEFAVTFLSTPVNGVNHAVAKSQTIDTSFGPEGITYTSTADPDGKVAMWLSHTSGQEGNTWGEVGNITFPSGDAILFRSFGMSGHIKNGPTAGSSYGGISYDIYDGTGRYKGADGVMVDTFIGPAGATSFPINGWGFFWLPTSAAKHGQ